MPSMKRRLAGALALLAFAGSAVAQTYPARPVRVIVTFAAASGSDRETT